MRSITLTKILVATVLSLCLVACEQRSSAPFTLNAPQLYSAKGANIAGNPQGSVSIVEFFDYRCHACKLSFPAMHSLTSIDPNVRIVYRELPILGYVSEIAAKAALASRYQQKYIKFHNALMSAPSLNSSSDVFDIALRVGLNVPKLKEDMNRSEIREQIDANYAIAERLNITATPTFLFANTRWKDKNMIADGAVMHRGAMTLTEFKKLIVSMRLNTK